MSKIFLHMLKNELRDKPFLEPSQTHLNETIRLSHLAYTNRKRLKRLSTFEMIFGQFRFIARPIWILQGVVLFCLCFFVRPAMVSDRMINYVPAFLSISSIFIAMTMLPFYGRSRKYKMIEIERSTRISFSRLILAKLCTLGIGDAVCLVAIILFTLGSVETPAKTILMFIVAPFLLACAGSLFILNRTNKSYGIFVATGFCIGLLVVYFVLIIEKREGLIRLSTAVHSIICMFLILALVFECRRLINQLPSTDLQELLF